MDQQNTNQSKPVKPITELLTKIKLSQVSDLVLTAYNRG
jgi:hypothetical protein